MSQTGSRRSMAPIMTSSALSRSNMIRPISSMPPPLWPASIGRSRQTVDFAKLDVVVDLDDLYSFIEYVCMVVSWSAWYIFLA